MSKRAFSAHVLYAALSNPALNTDIDIGDVADLTPPDVGGYSATP